MCIAQRCLVYLYYKMDYGRVEINSRSVLKRDPLISSVEHDSACLVKDV